MFNAMFNDIINTLIRDLSPETQGFIGLILFTVSLIAFRKSFRLKNDLKPIKMGWFIVFVLSLTMAVLYVTL